MPDTPDPADVIRARIAVLSEERARIDGEIGKLEHALLVLTDDRRDVNTNVNMTPAQRKRIAKARTGSEKKRRYVSKDAEEFARAISNPHGGGPGYSMRSLSEALIVEGYPASRGTWTSVFSGAFQIAQSLSDRVHELTGYRFPAKYVR